MKPLTKHFRSEHRGGGAVPHEASGFVKKKLLITALIARCLNVKGVVSATKQKSLNVLGVIKSSVMLSAIIRATSVTPPRVIRVQGASAVS